jgi:hypothetical protein
LFKSGKKETRTESTAISLIVLENVEALKINIEISFEKRNSTEAKGKIKIALNEIAEKIYVELSFSLPLNSDSAF